MTKRIIDLSIRGLEKLPIPESFDSIFDLIDPTTGIKSVTTDKIDFNIFFLLKYK